MTMGRYNSSFLFKFANCLLIDRFFNHFTLPESKKSFFDFALLRRVFQYASPYKKKFYWSVVLAILLAILTPVSPMLIQLTVNKYIANAAVEMIINITPAINA